jgi:hypothetical protein
MGGVSGVEALPVERRGELDHLAELAHGFSFKMPCGNVLKTRSIASRRAR